MDASKQNQYVFNLKLVEFLGLRQILDPETAKFYGYNVLHIIIAVFSVYILSITMLCPFGFYYFMNDVDAFIFYMGCIENYSFSVYKIMNIVYYSKDLWKCMNNTNFNLMVYKHYDISIFEMWRKRSLRVSFIYVVIAFIGMVSWISVPLVFSKTMVTIKNLDGSYSRFRINISNMYLIVSDETYNKHLNVFYVVEVIVFVAFYYFSLIFDICMVIICFAILCQLDIICNTIQSLGYKIRSNNNCSSMYIPRGFYYNIDLLKYI